MKDLEKFKHGEEGTHFCCELRLANEGGDATCCGCNPHKDCILKEKKEENPSSACGLNHCNHKNCFDINEDKIEWELEFNELFETYTDGSVYIREKTEWNLDAIKNFIKKEKELSYKQGKEDALDK